ncbi:AAA family ATPase [Methanolobus sp. WCC1]|uniref:AAA family ATPase n=2 Tax=Methanolobus TaxID=2220 RepID=UPI003253D3BA
MVNIWLIRPGEEARLWEEFQNKKCIAIGWEDDSYSKYQSLADVRLVHGMNNANSIWYFYKHMKIGDIAVAIKGQKGIQGIGKITSRYIEPNDPQNPGMEYGHVRFVEWLVVGKVRDLSYNLPQKTITPLKDNWKWEEIKNEYIQLDGKYKEIFAELESENKIDLSQLIKTFVSELDSDELKDSRNDFIARSENVHNKIRTENVDSLTEEDIFDILKNTEATSLGSLEFDRIIQENDGFDKFKRKLVDVLETTSLDESDVSNLFTSFKGLGRAYSTELMCLKQPDKFWIWNSLTDKLFSKMNVDSGQNLSPGKKYLAMQQYVSDILQDLKNNGLEDATYLDVNLFARWLKEKDVSIGSNNNITDTTAILDNPLLTGALSHTKNVILYGPPGTGKTYTVQQFIKTFLAGQLSKPKSFDDIKMEYLQDLTWYQITALSMYLMGKEKKIKVADLKSDEFIIFYSDRIKEREKGLSQSLWATLQIHSNPNSKNVKYERRSSPILFDKTENSEWYLLPDGIEYVETNLSEIVDVLSSKKGVSEEKTIEQFCTFVTFHQSYGYEDFIEGLKPVVNDNGDVSYRVEAGVFKEISERARHDTENNYVLVIDEINRGNIAKIFGELITLIEDDKRSEANKKGLSVKLPYSKTEFSVPSNLYILGTMNTADRSIALLDIALRRRFTFLEIMPDYSIIEFNVGGVNIDSLLEGLNITVSALIDRDHQIGHSYFCDLADLEEDLAKDKLYFIWYKKIIPLLQEYFYNDWEQLKLILGDFVVENGTHRVPALKDKIVNKSYEIRDFEGDWDAFSRALNKIYAGEQDFTVDKEISSSENVNAL